MRIGSCGRLSAAFVCVFLLAGSASATDTGPAIDAIRGIATRVDAATRETVAAHAEHRALAPGVADATKRVRGEFDAISRAATTQGFASDASFERKQKQVGRQLANLERAQAAQADAVLPALVATTDPNHTARLPLSVNRGASCASALTIAPGLAIQTDLAARGAGNSSLWLRIAPGQEGYTQLDTMPTPLDTEITLFGAKCPESEAEAIARNDDSLGLAASVAIDARSGVHYARVRNLGRAGRVVARAQAVAAILGRITDARNGHPLETRVEAIAPTDYYGPATYSDGSTGLYLLAVDPGSYYVSADGGVGGSVGYVTELYPDAPCSGMYFSDLTSCDLAHATLLALEDNDQVSGIDVALNIGGRISGVVRNTADGMPVANASITLYDSNSNATYGASTDAAGRYFVSRLVTSTYYVLANAGGFGSQQWDHIDCGDASGYGCQPFDGTPLAVVRDALTAGVDFDLQRKAHIRATATARDGVGTLSDAWWLAIYAEDGTYVTSFYNYGAGPLDAGPLSAGNYRAFVTSIGYFGQLWNGIDCLTDCLGELSGGTLITLGEGGEADISFGLLSIPSVSGTITDAITHAPIANASVAIVPSGATWVSASAYADASGRFTILPRETGNYYVWAWESLHRGTVYPAAPCINSDFASCDLSTAMPVTITYGGSSVTDLNIAMPPDGTIAGHVTLRVPSGVTPIDLNPVYESVSIYDVNGNYADYTTIDTSGNYLAVGLPEGTYHAIASGYSFGQIYAGIDCVNCAPAVGTPIVVTQGQSVVGIDFDPMPVHYLFGRVTDGNGAGIGAVALDLWDAGNGGHCGVGVTNADGYYALQDATSYCNDASKVSTDVDPDLYENQVYNGVPCPQGSAYLGLCSIDGGTDVTLPST
ncbi:MAG: carboxypeptidase regulatory-like domain-containing protein, partial [Rhodanobacteraceae bacterium]